MPFEKAGLDAAAVSDKARAQLAAVTRKPKAFPYKLGNPTLSRLWERSLSSLDDFNPSPPEDSLDGLIRKWSVANRQLVGKRTQLRLLAPGAGQRSELAGQVEQLEVRVRALHWRVIRLAGLSHLRLFAKIKAGEVEVLVELMEEERRRGVEEEERREREEDEKEKGGKAGEATGTEGEGETVVVGKEVGGEEEESEVALGTGGLTPPPPPPPAAAEVKATEAPAQVDEEPTIANAAAPPPAIENTPTPPSNEAKMDAEAAAPAAAETADLSLAPEVAPALAQQETQAADEQGEGEAQTESVFPEATQALPGTPKRAREGEDEEMADGAEGVPAKKARLDAEAQAEAGTEVAPDPVA